MSSGKPFPPEILPASVPAAPRRVPPLLAGFFGALAAVGFGLFLMAIWVVVGLALSDWRIG